MLEAVKFMNHQGESLESVKDGIYVNYSDLRDYIWEYTTQSNRIIDFQKGVVEKTIPLVILCDSEEQGIETRNRLFELGEKDVLKKKPGKIMIGDYYLPGYVIGSKKSSYLMNKRYMELELTFVTDTNKWNREVKYQFLPQTTIPEGPGENNPDISGGVSEGQMIENGAAIREFAFDFLKPPNLKVTYPLFDLPFDFVGTYGRRTIENDSFAECDFVMTIWGFVDNPSILIGGHPYTVYATVYEGERLEIDSAAGTVRKIGRLGEETNLYNAREKLYSVFQKIPPGVQTVSWPGTYGLDILIKDERSEPRWSL